MTALRKMPMMAPTITTAAPAIGTGTATTFSIANRLIPFCIVVPTSRDCLHLFLFGVLQIQQQSMLKRSMMGGEFRDHPPGGAVAKATFQDEAAHECRWTGNGGLY